MRKAATEAWGGKTRSAMALRSAFYRRRCSDNLIPRAAIESPRDSLVMSIPACDEAIRGGLRSSPNLEFKSYGSEADEKTRNLLLEAHPFQNLTGHGLNCSWDSEAIDK
jgi:hypothetical protein